MSFFIQFGTCGPNSSLRLFVIRLAPPPQRFHQIPDINPPISIVESVLINVAQKVKLQLRKASGCPPKLDGSRRLGEDQFPFERIIRLFFFKRAIVSIHIHSLFGGVRDTDKPSFTLALRSLKGGDKFDPLAGKYPSKNSAPPPPDDWQTSGDGDETVGAHFWACYLKYARDPTTNGFEEKYLSGVKLPASTHHRKRSQISIYGVTIHFQKSRKKHP